MLFPELLQLVAVYDGDEKAVLSDVPLAKTRLFMKDFFWVCPQCHKRLIDANFVGKTVIELNHTAVQIAIKRCKLCLNPSYFPTLKGIKHE